VQRLKDDARIECDDHQFMIAYQLAKRK